jgi:hypothetical protein
MVKVPTQVAVAEQAEQAEMLMAVIHGVVLVE